MPLRTWSLLCLCLALTNCRTDSNDVKRWADTQQGPRKLVAVLTHAKYPLDLRAEAAMTLIGMRPRGGRRAGIEQAVDALAGLSREERDPILARLVPAIVSELTVPPPAEGTEDNSIPFKDAAYDLLTSHDGKLVVLKERREALEGALKQWAMADFVPRMNASSQKVSMEQLLKTLGADSVRPLPEKMVPGATRIDRMAQLIADVGDTSTKHAASQKLVQLAQLVASPKWLEEKRPELEKANAASGQKPDEKAFAQQLARYQEEELLRLFSSMRRVGGKPAVEYLLAFAAESQRPVKQRTGALAAIEKHLDPTSESQITAIVKIAGADSTPDSVRGLALRRMGDLPRDKVAAPLYDLFDNDNWKVRWVAAELLLSKSKPEHVEEFMDHLSKVKHMSLSEPLRYGQLLGDMKGTPTPKELADSYSSSSKKPSVRVSALGYYYAHGTKQDLDELERLSKDRRKVPGCADEAKDCEWRCAEQEIATIGDYVAHCILPAIRTREAGPTQNTAAKASQEPQKAQ